MQVIGTAGHVDHGKSTLINRLTGINPDRLKEEQDREMSIELGFAWFELPNGDEVGIVDVPGHRDFIENMLSGIGGIDAALFVVAADEGVMPQTKEHLAIIDLLKVPAGVVALTKIDLIPDPEWLDLVEADLSDTLAGTVLEKAPIIRVSARTGEGIDNLTLAIQEILSQYPHRPDLNRPRLPVDRVFTLPGFGTIVTGTLMDGKLTVGDAVEILPAGLQSRIRGLQTHKQAENQALPGGRTAVNISGISVNQIERGQVIVHPGTYQPTKMMDVWCTLLPDADAPLKHNMEVKLFLGAAEVMARARVLGVRELEPGKDTFLQLMLQEPVVAQRQDRFILRRPSPPATIGGGQIVDPHPTSRHKRFNPRRLEELEQLLIGTPEEILLQTAHKTGAASLAKIIETSGLEAAPANDAAETLIQQGSLVLLNERRLVLPKETYDQYLDTITQNLTAYHQEYPLRTGMPREQLKSQMNLSPNVFDALISRLAENHLVKEAGAKIHMTGHEVVFTAVQQEQVAVLRQKFEEQPYTPPSVKQCLEEVSEPLLTALVETGQFIQVSEEVLFTPEAYQHMRSAVIDHIREQGSITLAQFRDQFNTSRKYAAALLEHLDQIGVTIRRDDLRTLRRP